MCRSVGIVPRERAHAVECHERSLGVGDNAHVVASGLDEIPNGFTNGGPDIQRLDLVVDVGLEVADVLDQEGVSNLTRMNSWTSWIGIRASTKSGMSTA